MDSAATISSATLKSVCRSSATAAWPLTPPCLPDLPAKYAVAVHCQQGLATYMSWAYPLLRAISQAYRSSRRAAYLRSLQVVHRNATRVCSSLKILLLLLPYQLPGLCQRLRFIGTCHSTCSPSAWRL